MAKIAVSYRLSARCLSLIHGLAKRLGLSQASVVELSVRKLAERED